MVEEKRFAVLVDAENVSSKYIKYIMDEISDYGVVTYKRIYTDWTQAASGSWRNVLSDYAFSPIQQYSYSSGKNSTDSAMIIDAMDILYSDMVEGFCIVSSDSDFTKLAIRLKESGMMVIGMGERKTPKAFSAACNVFKYLDILAASDEDMNEEKNVSEIIKGRSVEHQKLIKSEKIDKCDKNDKNGNEKTISDLKDINETIQKILSDREENGKTISIGELGNLLVKRYPDFDVRNYGYSKLSKFLENQSFIRIELQGNVMYATLSKHQSEESLQSEIIGIVKKSNNKIGLSKLGQIFRDKHPGFNVRDYGYTQFQKFLQAIPELKIKSEQNGHGNKSVTIKSKN